MENRRWKLARTPVAGWPTDDDLRFTASALPDPKSNHAQSIRPWTPLSETDVGQVLNQSEMLAMAALLPQGPCFLASIQLNAEYENDT